HRHPLLQVSGIGDRRYPATFSQGSQSIDGGHQFHPVVRRMRFRAPEDALVLPIPQDARPPAGAGIAQARPIREERHFLQFFRLLSSRIIPGSRDRWCHAGAAILWSSVSAVCTLPMSAAPRVLKLANVNVPFAACLIPAQLARRVAREPRFPSRSSLPRNSLTLAVSRCDPFPVPP